MQLSAVHRVFGSGCHLTVSHIGYFLVIRIEAVIGYIGLSAYGQAIVVDNRITRCDAVHFHVFRQFDIQRAVSGYYADIPV